MVGTTTTKNTVAELIKKKNPSVSVADPLQIPNTFIYVNEPEGSSLSKG